MRNDKIIRISNEFRKSGMGFDYSVSFEDDKKVYIVSSEGLKKSLREIIFDNNLFKDAFGGMKIEGRNFQSSYFSYQEGVNSPDKFMAVSDWEERLEEIVEYSEQKERETNERMKNERKQVNRPVEENNSPFDSWNKDAIRFRRWDTQGNLVEERVKLLDNSVFFPEELDKDNSSKIVEIDDKGNIVNQEQAIKNEGKKSLSGKFSAISDEQREKDKNNKKEAKRESEDSVKTQLDNDNSHKKGSSNFVKPFLFGGAFFFIIGVVLALKP